MELISACVELRLALLELSALGRVAMTCRRLRYCDDALIRAARLVGGGLLDDRVSGDDVLIALRRHARVLRHAECVRLSGPCSSEIALTMLEKVLDLGSLSDVVTIDRVVDVPSARRWSAPAEVQPPLMHPVSCPRGEVKVAIQVYTSNGEVHVLYRQASGTAPPLYLFLRLTVCWLCAGCVQAVKHARFGVAPGETHMPSMFGWGDDAVRGADVYCAVSAELQADCSCGACVHWRTPP